MKIFEMIAAGIRKLVTKAEGAVDRVENTVEGIVDKIVSINDIPQDVLKARLDAAAVAVIPKWGQKLDWEHSIVDLMKLVELDSSADARAELSREFNPEKKYEPIAADNIWLHKQVMHELSVRGYAIPQP